MNTLDLAIQTYFLMGILNCGYKLSLNPQGGIYFLIFELFFWWRPSSWFNEAFKKSTYKRPIKSVFFAITVNLLQLFSAFCLVWVCSYLAYFLFDSKTIAYFASWFFMLIGMLFLPLFVVVLSVPAMILFSLIAELIPD